MAWIRARSAEQKEQRIAEIVDATARLYENHDFEEITFALIAKEARFTRSNLYKYFNTKEEVFLELIKHDIAEWRREVADRFRNQSYSIQAFSEMWVDIHMKHKRMVELVTIMYTTLEKNASLESLISFKKKTQDEFGLLAEILLDALPVFTLDTLYEFLFAQLAMAIGTCPMFTLSQSQKEAMERVGMTTDPRFYRRIYVRSIEHIIEGLSK
jgi:AcrR family transcriptional regulator